MVEVGWLVQMDVTGGESWKGRERWRSEAECVVYEVRGESA